jgi:nitroreductase
MDFFDTVKKRRAIRAFSERQVEADKLGQILDAANSAPSAGNLQSYEIFMVKGSGKRGALSEACFSQKSVALASVVLVFCADVQKSVKNYGEKGGGVYAIQDATISAAYCQLAATALGLATVWVGSFDEKKVLSFLNARDGLKPAAVIPIGYAAETPLPRPRRSIGDIVHEV